MGDTDWGADDGGWNGPDPSGDNWGPVTDCNDAWGADAANEKPENFSWADPADLQPTEPYPTRNKPKRDGKNDKRDSKHGKKSKYEPAPAPTVKKETKPPSWTTFVSAKSPDADPFIDGWTDHRRKRCVELLNAKVANKKGVKRRLTWSEIKRVLAKENAMIRGNWKVNNKGAFLSWKEE